MVDKGYDGIRNNYPAHTIYQPFKARRNRPLTEERKAYNRHLARYRMVAVAVLQGCTAWPATRPEKAKVQFMEGD
jgi:hypothetical protein